LSSIFEVCTSGDKSATQLPSVRSAKRKKKESEGGGAGAGGLGRGGSGDFVLSELQMHEYRAFFTA
jgi:hypothetical protein